MQSQKGQNNHCLFTRQKIQYHIQTFNITVIQVYAPTSNTEEAKLEWFYKGLEDLLELTPKKDVHFFIGDWNG